MQKEDIPTDEILRRLYLEILNSSCESATAKFVFAKCMEHQAPVLTFFQRILDGKDKSHLKDGLSHIKAVLLKPVNDTCNLACDYCYQGVGSYRSRGSIMTTAELEQVTKELLASPRRDIQFLWHGGEPLMAGIEFYEAALEFQKDHNIHNCSIWNGFQTNGLLIDDAWIEFIKNNSFGVSLSFDGLENVHNKHRINHNKKGTYSDLLTVFKKLRENCVEFNVITVINDESVIYVDEYWNLIKELEIKNLDIHPACNIGLNSATFLEPKLYSDFFCRIFDHWLQNPNSGLKISMIEEFFRVLTGNPIKTCYHSGVCSDIIAIEGNGNVIPCTRPFHKTEHMFGNIKTNSLNGIIREEKFLDFKRKDLSSQQKATECKWYSICHNGCPQQRLENEEQNILSGSVYCQCTSGLKGGNYAIWEHMYDRLKLIFDSEKNINQTH